MGAPGKKKRKEKKKKKISVYLFECLNLDNPTRICINEHPHCNVEGFNMESKKNPNRILGLED